VIRYDLRENQSQTGGIKGMAGELSRGELLELSRQRIRANRYSAIPRVTEQISRLQASKNAEVDDERSLGLPVTSIFDLTNVVLDTSCRVLEVGSSKCWDITYQGPDLVGDPLKVMAVLSKDTRSVLIFTDFQPMIRITP
jgi:hypothetical protein